MFWKEFNLLKNLLFSFLFLFLLFSCKNSENQKNNQQNKKEIAKEDATSLSSKEEIIRKVESKLGINAKEKYGIQLFYKYLDSDTLKDVVILVNRPAYAIKHVEKNGSLSFFKKIGYTGRFNYIFIKKGGEKELISTTPVGSNIHFPLQIHFLKLTSLAKTDFYVTFRIRNSKYRNYYTLHFGQLQEVFSCPVFEGVGTQHPVTYYIESRTSKLRMAKDIVMYKGVIPNYNPANIKDANTYNPIIKSTDSLFAYFIYNEKKRKYVTPMRPRQDTIKAK